MAPDDPLRPRETLWFVGLTLLISWSLGAWWLRDESLFGFVLALMWTPGVVSIACAWVFRRESPRAAGLTFAGFRPWLVAMAYPFLMTAFCVSVAYAWGAVSGNTAFISFQPEALAATGKRAVIWLVLVVLWLCSAAAYRWRWPDRLRGALPRGVSWLAYPFQALLLLPTFVTGEMGEELGWRGYVVRRWVDRPLVAVAITAPVWASFHLPVVFSAAQRSHPVLGLVFLASIAVAAVPFAAMYRWSRSVWPCAVMHMSWNAWNPILLGDVYTGHPSLFMGEVRVFNGEGLFGLVFNGLIAVFFLLRWRAEEARVP